MPLCGRITGYRSRPSDNGGLAYQIFVHRYARALPFAERMRKALPYAHVTDADPIRLIIANQSRAAEVDAYLQLLRTSVSIADQADESYALGMHWYRDLDGRSDLGDLVYQAKSYRRGTGNRRQAELLSERIIAWLRSHPRYRRADAVVPIPPGNPDKAYDLPSLIGQRVAQELQMRLLRIDSAVRSPQKGREENPSHPAIAGRFSVPHDLAGLTVVLLDDLYDSGETITEGTRALRAAGAHTVLALTATKTSSHCEGVYPYSANWQDEERAP